MREGPLLFVYACVRAAQQIRRRRLAGECARDQVARELSRITDSLPRDCGVEFGRHQGSLVATSNSTAEIIRYKLWTVLGLPARMGRNNSHTALHSARSPAS